MNAALFGLKVVGNSGGEQLVVCPFHHDRKPSAWWNPIKNVFYCSVCALGLSAKQLADRLELDIEGLEEEEWQGQVADFDLTLSGLDCYRGVVFDCYPDYLAERGISEETSSRYKLGYSTASPQAIRFVIQDINERPTGYVERYIDSEAAGTRYRKSGEMQPLWPMPHLLELEPDERFFVFEGPFSAMRFHQAYPYLHSFALFGAKANRTIADMLRALNPVFLYDHDTAGINACYRMRQLMPLARCYTLSISVDDMNDKQIGNMMKKLINRKDW